MRGKTGARNLLSAIAALCLLIVPVYAAAQSLPPLPANATLALSEDWSSGLIDGGKWYSPHKKWGQGNNGVTPENVRLGYDVVEGQVQNVLVLEAHGDQYNGPIVGHGGAKTRVGGMLVTKEFFASGRYEVVLKIGSTQLSPGGPAEPKRPAGAVPAIWTYGYRYLEVPYSQKDNFVPATPLYNPHMQVYGIGANEYWSELDFPEFGKGGNFNIGLYNTFLQNRHQPKEYNVSAAIDGQYHTFTTEWRTMLQPMPGITDAQVVESEGYWWIKDIAVPFDQYLGNPLKRLGPNQYSLYRGNRVDHWIDGMHVAENTLYVPSMAAQLTLGIWLPNWAGAAPWQTATAAIASVNIWLYADPGDVRGILTADVPDNYTPIFVLGDLNNDLGVDLDDWNIFKTRYGLDTSGLAIDQRPGLGDLNQNGHVGQDDFLRFRSIFRSVITDGSTSAAHGPVPEPGSLNLLMVSLMLTKVNRFAIRRERLQA